MRKHGKKLTAALLALVLGLGLVACGGDDGDGDDQLISGTVYVPQFLDPDLDLDYIDSICTDGENIYILGNSRKETEVTDPDTGETYTSYDSYRGFYRIPLDGSAAVELENFSAGEIPDEEGYCDVSDLFAGKDGTFWVWEDARRYSFDLPEDFDETTDSRWNYMTGSDEVNTLRQIDSTGVELSRLDLDPYLHTLDEESQYIYGYAFDDSGNCYVATYNNVAVLAPDSSVIFSIQDENLLNVRPVLLANGKVGILCYVNDPTTETYSTELRELDVTSKGWGTAYTLPSSNYVTSAADGGGDYLFYYQTKDTLYGYNAETGEAESILSWISADINSNNISFYTILPDGRVAVMTESWRSGSRGTYEHYELALLTATDANTLPEKTTLTYATVSMDYTVRNRIIAFNRSSEEYRIEVRDYSDIAGDYTAGITKLNTEIIAGNVPDILDTSSIPIRQYANKGFLEDLWPYIDADPDLNREGLMTHVLECAELDGKLYQVFNNFTIRTVIGSQDIWGDKMGWTLDEMQAVLAEMPEGSSLFSPQETQESMLNSLLQMNLGSYVDWTTGACAFDSDDFKAVLELCAASPAEYDWESAADSDDEPTLIMKGMQMLRESYLYDLQDLQMEEAIFGGKDALLDYDALLAESDTAIGGSTFSSGIISAGGSGNDVYVLNGMVKSEGRYITYVGYPTESDCGSAFSPGSGCMAISSRCADKAGAWSFVRQSLLPVLDEDGNSESSYSYGFYVNKADFDKAAEKAMEKTYVEDANGNKVLDADGNPIEEAQGGYGYGDSVMIQLRAISQTEYDQFMELYNAIDKLTEYDTAIYDIVKEQAGAYFSGDKSLDETAQLIQNRVELYVNENR